MLQKGQPAPDFSCADQDGNIHRLSDYKGSKLVLFFYPKADTPGCTAEACNLMENHELLLSKGYKILGVSADPPKKQKKYHEKYGFPFPLLCDEDHSVCNAYGVWGKKKFMGKEFEGINRTTFIIDAEGNIEEIITKVDTKNHAAQIP